MAVPKKTKSGSWHLTLYIGRDNNGKDIYKSITAPTKAKCTQKAKEAKRAAADAARRPKIADLTRVCDVVDKYIGLCKVLSPTTVEGYEKIRRTAFSHLMEVPVRELTAELVQTAINIEAYREGRRGRISAKTLANEWGLISSALRQFEGLKFNVKLPRTQKHLKEYPDPAEVMRAVIGTDIELPCLLALWLSFSMSEIRGLKWSDIRGDTITINRVLVDVGTVPTIKDTAKTAARIRRHRLPPYLQDLLAATERTSEFICPYTHRQIASKFNRICEANDFDLTFHGLRHLNASVMLMLNIPEKYAMERGGWSTPYVMQTVYQHTFSDARLKVDDQINGYFNTIIDTIKSREPLKIQGSANVRIPYTPPNKAEIESV